jgi:predicted PurR-regulated permease PerM
MIGQAVGVLFLTTFLLIEDDAFKRKLIRQFDSMGSKRVTVHILADIATQIERFIWVQVATCALVAVVTGIGLWWLEVEQPAVWGVFAGVMNLVPFFGPLIVTFVVGTVAFLQFGSLPAAGGVALMTIVITSIEGHFITPQLLSRTASLNLVAIFVAIAFWSWLWGVAGMLLAVPILMAVKVVCDRIEEWQPVGDFLGPSETRPATEV